MKNEKVFHSTLSASFCAGNNGNMQIAAEGAEGAAGADDDNGDWWQPTEAEVMPNKKSTNRKKNSTSSNNTKKCRRRQHIKIIIIIMPSSMPNKQRKTATQSKSIDNGETEAVLRGGGQPVATTNDGRCFKLTSKCK